MKVNVKKVKSKLSEVLDPELNISIVDLGLVYKVEIIKKTVKVTMTLTTIGCPLIATIEEEIKKKVEEIGIDRKNVKVSLTFDPPWSMEKMSPKAKAILGI
jgi:metal-sulfur cluster biosynthetic enzyme